MKDWIYILFGVAMMVGSFGGWITHIFACLSTEAWGFLIAGALFFPIGIIHGIGIWFGAW